MSEERKKVLEMLAEGKISSDEADRLLDKIESRPDPRRAVLGETSESRRPGVPKYLRVLVDGAGDKVNIRVPLALVRTGIKLTTMLPSEANKKIKAQGIDLSELGELQGYELVKALAELTVDVDSSDGSTVRVFCE